MGVIPEYMPKPDDLVTVDENAHQLNRSALRTAALLIAAGSHPAGASAAELAAETGIPRPTAHRLLLSLAHTGLLARNGAKFSLGWQADQLSRMADPYRNVLPRIQLVIDLLAAELNESVEYTVFTGHTAQETIAQASGSRLLAPTQNYVGQGFPLHASATGKLLLSSIENDQILALLPDTLETFTDRTIHDPQALLKELDVARAQGYTTLDGELEVGLYVVAVPVYDSAGRLVAGLAISGLDQRMKPYGTPALVKALQASALELSEIVSPR